MSTASQPTLVRLLAAVVGDGPAARLLATIDVHPALLADTAGNVSRAVLAQAMNLVLFDGLLARVPAGRAYVDDVRAGGARVVFDHGALRTVKAPATGALPPGEAAFRRILDPLGYRLAGTYPLDRLGMTGRSYAQADHPEEIAQFFLSELHPERFSERFQAATARVLATSRDPLDTADLARLDALARDRVLPMADAVALLPRLVACFDRWHDEPALADYEILLAESAEMAWIATEGNAFNHATDRVADVVALADRQKQLGRPMKDKVEVSASGRVLQTAFRAAEVERGFRLPSGDRVTRIVPGSFYEFITRKTMVDADSGKTRLDLGFDSSNAQGIFKMTAAA